MPLTAREHLHRLAAGHFARLMQLMALLCWRIPADDGLHRYRLHHKRLALHQKGKALLVGAFKCRLQSRQIAQRHNQRGIRAFVFHMHTAMHHDLALADLLALELSTGRLCERFQFLLHLRQSSVTQTQFHRLLTNHTLIRQAHAISRQHTRIRMHKNFRHAQRIGHQTSMLATRAAKALQGVARYVVAASHRNLLDRIGHLLHSDIDKTLSYHFGRFAHTASDFLEFL